MSPYYTPPGGLPPQTALMTGRAVFTDAYCVIPKGCFSDIVTSNLPGWKNTRLWLIARPMSGFSETFSQYVMEVGPGGGADLPEPDPVAEGVIFVTGGRYGFPSTARNMNSARAAMPISRPAATGGCITAATIPPASTGSASFTNTRRA